MLTRTVITAAGLLLTTGFAAIPAQAAAPRYSPEQICGPGFHQVKDGHRAMRTRHGDVFGHVYLMYSKRTGQNCVTAVKTEFAGRRTLVGASLTVRGGARSEDAHKYRFYAETGHVPGAWKCVKYSGWMRTPDGRVEAWGGRSWWGNCQG